MTIKLLLIQILVESKENTSNFKSSAILFFQINNFQQIRTESQLISNVWTCNLSKWNWQIYGWVGDFGWRKKYKQAADATNLCHLTDKQKKQTKLNSHLLELLNPYKSTWQFQLFWVQNGTECRYLIRIWQDSDFTDKNIDSVQCPMWVTVTYNYSGRD